MMEQLPIQLDCFLMTYGFFENDKAPGSHLHAQFRQPIHKKRLQSLVSEGWKPSFKGEEPPF